MWNLKWCSILCYFVLLLLFKRFSIFYCLQNDWVFWCSSYVLNFLCSYLPERKILDGISFAVPAGKSVAIVGTSGSGKQSLIFLDKKDPFFVLVIEIFGSHVCLVWFILLLKLNKGVYMYVCVMFVFWIRNDCLCRNVIEIELQVMLLKVQHFVYFLR